MARATSSAELEAQVEGLKAMVAQLVQEKAINEAKAERKHRVPTDLPKFKGKRNNDVHQWLFQIENACRMYGHPIEDASRTLCLIAGSAMADPASVWFLHWSMFNPVEDQTWMQSKCDALHHFEASNYQAGLRKKLIDLKQTSDIEEYNGRYAELIFRVEDMGDLDQISSYVRGLKPRTQSYLMLQDPRTLVDAMDFAVKFQHAHFSSEDQKPERDDRGLSATTEA